MTLYVVLGALTGLVAYLLVESASAVLRTLSARESTRRRSDDPGLGCEPTSEESARRKGDRCRCGADLTDPLRVAAAFSLRDVFCPRCRSWRKVNDVVSS